MGIRSASLDAAKGGSPPDGVLAPAWRWLVLASVGLFLASGLALAGYCVHASYAPALGGHDDPVHSAPTAGAAPADWRKTLAELREYAATPRGVVEEARPPTPKGPPPAVNLAIARGVAYLKGELAKPNTDPHGIGGLIALALLESGVPADDPALAKAVARIRDGVPHFNGTYVHSVAILLLDRVRDKGDEPLIRTLASRLIASQNAAGGWDYGTAPLSGAQEKELRSLLLADSVPAGSDPRLAALPAVLYRRGKEVAWRGAPRDDNSITQFAAMALWVARKHDVPVDRSLALAGARFRATQADDGSWGYARPDAGASPRDSMTCAGLVGLAVARGADPDAKRRPGSAADPHAEKALRFLSGTLRRAAKEPIPNPARPRGAPVGAASDGDLYYLWSLERVGVLYDLKTVGGEDWHEWGTKLLLAVQNPDGSWSDRWGEQVGTCFALLFLQRVNVAEDLTARLNLLGKVKDPFQRVPTPDAPRPKEPARVEPPAP